MAPWLDLFALESICFWDLSPDAWYSFLVSFVWVAVHWLTRFVFWLLLWLLGLICLLWSTLTYEIRLPIADMAIWLALCDLQYTGSADWFPDCWCGSMVCFDQLAVHWLIGFVSRLLMCICGSLACYVCLGVDLLTRFVSRLLMLLLGWLCSTISTLA